MPDIEMSEARADALLAERKITEAQQRAACVTLAGLALIAARGDKQAAKGMLREALEAIGAIPYQRTPAPYFFGRALS
jgi:hypothetical protein